MAKMDVPQGTLDLLILAILSREALHGYGISQRLAELTRDEFLVNPGSLFPALYKLEQDGKLASQWRTSENNRRAKYYRLTRAGKKQLAREQERWNRALVAISHVLEGA
jgi:PadR family transcriptional regulator PadR